MSVIHADFSKALDRINHKLVIFKLHAVDFSLYLVKWINSYLFNRSYSVLFNSFQSSELKIMSELLREVTLDLI